MRRVTWMRLLAVALLVGSVAAIAVGRQQRDEALAQRDRALAATRADRRAGEEASDEVARIEAAIDQARRAAQRDRHGARRIDDAIEALAALQARLDEAQAAVVGLSALSEDQLAEIAILGSCVATLDAARAVLVAGDPAASATVLEQGRGSCRRAEELVDGITDAVHPYDFPDPAVIAVGSTYYAFATNGPTGTVQVLTSTDLDDWSIRGSALSAVATWARPGFTWAPSVIRTEAGYALYYAVRDRASGLQCVSVALSAEPAGPYVDGSAEPLLCHQSQGGAIDASPFRDEAGTLYLAWKSEGETIGGAAQIWVQPLDASGTRRQWFPTPLLRTDRAWEGRTVEGPSMVRAGDRWLLIYSGNAWNTDRYAVGYATCDGPLGPCAKPADNVLLASDGAMSGPGGAEVFTTASGGLAVAYAAWDPDAVGPPHPRRMHIATLSLTPEGPVLSD